MSQSKILFNKTTHEIKYCIPKPSGVDCLPADDSLYMGAKIPQNKLKDYDIITVSDRYLTKTAKKRLRVKTINSEIKAITKPKANISVDKKEIDISVSPIFTISVNLTDILENETFSEIQLSLEDVDFTISLTDNQGSKDIELSEIGKYKIKCNDDRFRSNTPIEVEGV